MPCEYSGSARSRSIRRGCPGSCRSRAIPCRIGRPLRTPQRGADRQRYERSPRSWAVSPIHLPQCSFSDCTPGGRRVRSDAFLGISRYIKHASVRGKPCSRSCAARQCALEGSEADRFSITSGARSTRVPPVFVTNAVARAMQSLRKSSAGARASVPIGSSTRFHRSPNRTSANHASPPVRAILAGGS